MAREPNVSLGGVLTGEEDHVRNTNLMARAMILAAATVWLSNGALAATCGKISASATSKTEQKAIFQANRIGKRETDKLDRIHGRDIEYQQARVACKSANGGVFCKITQRYCIDDDSGQDFPDNFGEPGDVDPNTPQCRKLLRQCNNGKNSACAKYENTCQND
jgi:hypothetical protein